MKRELLWTTMGDHEKKATVELIAQPGEEDWLGVKQRALVTVGKSTTTPPTLQWKHMILEARHSPIRSLRFSFLITGLPYWVSVHLCRHIHAQPYVRSQRNDRQSQYNRDNAPQDAPVDMIWDVNAEELMIIANKRLCNQASKETRAVVQACCELVLLYYPEFKGLLVPMCEYCGGVCHEMYPCGKRSAKDES